MGTNPLAARIWADQDFRTLATISAEEAWNGAAQVSGQQIVKITSVFWRAIHNLTSYNSEKPLSFIVRLMQQISSTVRTMEKNLKARKYTPEMKQYAMDLEGAALFYTHKNKALHAMYNTILLHAATQNQRDSLFKLYERFAMELSCISDSLMHQHPLLNSQSFFCCLPFDEASARDAIASLEDPFLQSGLPRLPEAAYNLSKGRCFGECSVLLKRMKNSPQIPTQELIRDLPEKTIYQLQFLHRLGMHLMNMPDSETLQNEQIAKRMEAHKHDPNSKLNCKYVTRGIPSLNMPDFCSYTTRNAIQEELDEVARKKDWLLATSGVPQSLKTESLSAEEMQLGPSFALSMKFQIPGDFSHIFLVQASDPIFRFYDVDTVYNFLSLEELITGVNQHLESAYPGRTKLQAHLTQLP